MWPHCDSLASWVVSYEIDGNWKQNRAKQTLAQSIPLELWK